MLRFCTVHAQLAAPSYQRLPLTLPFLPASPPPARSLFEVEGIPTLVVLDEQGRVITTEGVDAVRADPTGARFPWRPQPLEQLSGATVGRVNSGRALVVVLDCADDAAAEALAGSCGLGSVAVATRAAPGGEEWSFLWARRGDELAQRVLSAAGVVPDPESQPPAGHVAVLLDIPGEQATWNLTARGVELSEAGLAGAVADAQAGRLGPGRKLGGDSDGDDEE